MSKPNLGERTTRMYHRALNMIAKVAGPQTTRVIEARIRYKRRLNLRNPSNLAEKVSWLEFNTDQTMPTALTDKVGVREYVASKGLQHILIPMVGGPWSRLDEIDFNKLPNKFALKAAHGCAMNLLVADKTTLDQEAESSRLADWLSRDYGRAALEPHYKAIPHRLYAEEYLTEMDGLVDYKFHCINGEPEFVLVCSQRDSKQGVRLNLYDTNWQPIDGLVGKKMNSDALAQPAKFAEMLEISRILSKDLPMVRVDLYQNEEEILFGELTFSPAGGVFPNFSEDFLSQQGEKLDLNSWGFK